MRGGCRQFTRVPMAAAPLSRPPSAASEELARTRIDVSPIAVSVVLVKGAADQNAAQTAVHPNRREPVVGEVRPISVPARGQSDSSEAAVQ